MSNAYILYKTDGGLKDFLWFQREVGAHITDNLHCVYIYSFISLYTIHHISYHYKIITYYITYYIIHYIVYHFYFLQVISSLLFEDAAVPAAEHCEDLARLTERHFISTIPPTDKKARAQKRCRVCYLQGRRKDVRYHCLDCPTKPGLCMEPCYKLYHTVHNLKNLV